jgi:hypothetical protein
MNKLGVSLVIKRIDREQPGRVNGLTCFEKDFPIF